MFSTCSSCFLHLQAFVTPSSASRLIPLQTVLLRTPTDAALLSFGSLFFFNMLASMFLAFSKLYLASISRLFFKPFPAFSDGFSRVSCLQFPHFPNCFFDFLGFSKFAIHFFLQFNGFVTIFLHFPPFSTIFHQFLKIFLHFPLFFPTFFLPFFPTFFLPFSRDLGRIEPYRHQIA